LGSFIVGPLGRDQIEQDIESLLGGEGLVIRSFRFVSGGVGGEFFNDGLHGFIIPQSAQFNP
jgi:hypothetical protein